MNQFDERYDIRLAVKSDIDAIMEFIGAYWKQGHIMSQDRRLFEYEFVEDEQVHFVLAADRKTGEIEGIFGYLLCSHAESSKRDLWGSIWKVREAHQNIPLLGVELAKRVYSLTGCRMHIGNGANPKTTIPLRRLFFGEKTGKMKQFYRLNPKIEEFKIARITNRSDAELSEEYSGDESGRYILYESMEQLRRDFTIEKADGLPYKDSWYVEKRFFSHPYYRYQVYGLKEKEGAVSAIFAAREIERDGSRILRIVDYIGSQQCFACTGDMWLELFQKRNYEYIDFYEFGFEERCLLAAGFRQRMDSDPNIIPNYFEPFIQENADIWVHYQLDGTTFYKADGDQDRPNQAREVMERTV